MGSAHDIMQTYATKDLHAQFPDYDGWTWAILPAANSGSVMYRVTRYYHHRQQEAILAVSIEARPSAGCVSALLSVDADNQAVRYLLVPQGADVSGVPAGIGIFTMTAFGFSGGKLAWLSKKKNAMRYLPKESAHASSPMKSG